MRETSGRKQFRQFSVRSAICCTSDKRLFVFLLSSPSSSFTFQKERETDLRRNLTRRALDCISMDAATKRGKYSRIKKFKCIAFSEIHAGRFSPPRKSSAHTSFVLFANYLLTSRDIASRMPSDYGVACASRYRNGATTVPIPCRCQRSWTCIIVQSNELTE